VQVLLIIDFFDEIRKPIFETRIASNKMLPKEWLKTDRVGQNRICPQISQNILDIRVRLIYTSLS
jgi:hypothetical protein